MVRQFNTTMLAFNTVLFFRVDIKVNSEVISNKSLFCVFGFFEFELLFFTDKWSS